MKESIAVHLSSFLMWSVNKNSKFLYFIINNKRTTNITAVYRVSQEECARLREGVPYVKVYRYNPKHLCPNLNGYGDNDQRSLKL